jgi:hypothetical protein
VFRVPESATPLDHTSILATVEHRWSLPALTRRDAAAPDVGATLTLDSPRTDDPLARVSTPSRRPPQLNWLASRRIWIRSAPNLRPAPTADRGRSRGATS